MAKGLDKILDELETQGFAITRTKRGHWKVTLGSQYVTSFAGTASDWRSDKNALADCKRAGLIWPPPPRKK